MLSPDIEDAVQRDHRATAALIGGDAGPKKEMFSRGPDASLANPLGPPVLGWDAVAAELDRVAGLVREGEAGGFERVSEFATPDLAYIVEIERSRARFEDAAEPAPFALRVTTIFRREPAGWRIAHRHADPITSARSIQSMRG